MSNDYETVLGKDGKNRKATRVKCKYCGTSFLKHVRRFKTSPNNHYCTHRCSSLDRRRRVQLKCNICSKAIERVPSALKANKTNFVFCSLECKAKAHRIGSRFSEMLPPHYGTADVPWTNRRKVFKYYPAKCEFCNYNEYEEILEIHHIDRNRKNNKIENLCILCPMCHKLDTMNLFRYRRENGALLQEKINP